MDRMTIETPVGPILIEGDESGVSLIEIGASETATVDTRPAKSTPVAQAARQLQAYFAGKRCDFNVPLSPKGTEFQRRVWHELERIPYGRTISYGELAKRVGNPKASRAVGAANGANPLPIVVPCHRVIGANGTLTGFGAGIRVKAKLLEIEGVPVGTQPELF
jgi:methylated-DNA-[protein]-cysteine S-methyltransferase